MKIKILIPITIILLVLISANAELIPCYDTFDNIDFDKTAYTSSIVGVKEHIAYCMDANYGQGEWSWDTNNMNNNRPFYYCANIRNDLNYMDTVRDTGCTSSDDMCRCIECDPRLDDRFLISESDRQCGPGKQCIN